MMRKRPSGQNNNYGHQKRRHPHGSSSHGHSNNGGGNRPRKNYSALREKYMGQARDALASGDRVMAEYFYQHADHCYRMMMEENGGRPQRPQQQGQVEGEAAQEGEATQEMSEMPEMQNTNPLPAFITSGYNTDANKPAEEPVVQNWEDRDA
jgi:hypothetical protein